MNSDKPLARLSHAGPAVVLIHGYGADRFTWLTTTPSLLSRASVWLLDLPGHGKGDPDCGDGSLQALVERVRTSLQLVGLDQVHLVGHSLGARIAMELAARQPELVQSLFLISPAGVGGSINLDFLRNFHDADSEDNIVELLRLLVHDPRLISRSLGSRVLDYLERDGTRMNLHRIASGLTAAQADMQATIHRLREIGIPCRSVWGLEDQINPPAPDVTGKLPGDIHWLEACGHLPHLEHSSTVNRALREFHAGVLSTD